ncbi:MAG: T9SS type A sorting domain-containing protein [Bacteroidota bacterium]
MKTIVLLTMLMISTGVSQNYFPVNIGNKWIYTGSFDTTHKLIKTIIDEVNIVGIRYFLYGNINSMVDTIRQDYVGNIWKYKYGVEQLWFDFTKENGEVYWYPFTNNRSYTVKVRKGLTVKTYNGTYTDCISLYFNDTTAIDDEVGYIFARGIGIIQKYGAWSDDVLYSANIQSGPSTVQSRFGLSPETIVLSQNYPNPFNPSTTITYRVVNPGFVKLSVFNQLGQEVASLVNEIQRTGNYSVKFDGNNLPSGVYYYNLTSSSITMTRHCLLIK